MRRRKFIAFVGGAAVAWPLAARAQQPTIPVIGFIGAESPEPYAERLNAFRVGLKEIGFVEGQNVAVEYRWAERQYSRFPDLAAQLVQLQVSVIAATGGEPAPQSAEAATQTIPIVFTANGDPVRQGLVASLNRPRRECHRCYHIRQRRYSKAAPADARNLAASCYRRLSHESE